MKLIGLARLGRDGEVRYSADGKPILDVSLAYDFGRKGSKETQWVRASMFGDRAEKVAEYFTKGKLMYVEIDELHVRTFEKEGEKRSALEGILQNFEFAGKKDD